MNRPHRFGIGRLLLRSTLCSALFLQARGMLKRRRGNWQ